MSARLFLFALLSATYASASEPRRLPGELPPAMGSGNSTGPEVAVNYRWMWGDAGKHWFGHLVAESNPFRWSNWAGSDDTIQSLRQYNKRGDDERPVEMEVGPPPLQTRTFSNIAGALEYLNSRPTPSTTELSYSPESPLTAATTTPYPEGVFLDVGAGRMQIEDEVVVMKDVGGVHLPRVLPCTFLTICAAGAGSLILAISLAFYRSRVVVQGPIPDEEAPLDPSFSNDE
jgi:hypothetical protein